MRILRLSPLAFLAAPFLGETIVNNTARLLGDVVQGTPVTVEWTVNATNVSGLYNATVFADSSNAGNDTGDDTIDWFTVYEDFPTKRSDSFNPSLNQSIGPSQNLTAAWECNVGDYRIADLRITANTSTTGTVLQILSYDGTKFVDVEHSKVVNTNGAGDGHVPLSRS